MDHIALKSAIKKIFKTKRVNYKNLVKCIGIFELDLKDFIVDTTALLTMCV